MRTNGLRFALWLALSFVAVAPAQAAPYMTAEFSGGLNQVTSTMRSRLTAAGYDASLFNCSTCADATSVGGHVVWDAAVPVPVTPTPVNVFSVGAISGVSNDLIFELEIDGLSFHFGDAGIQGGPAIQYLNGAFNGFFFAENFLSPNQTQLQLNVQGRVFTLLRLVDRQTLFSGFINAPLANAQGFDPANPPTPGGTVPEPSILALLALGLAGLGFARRRGRGTR